MSSTTSRPSRAAALRARVAGLHPRLPWQRRSEDGQILVIFVGGLVTIIAIAALVFDTGQALLDRRSEQNAADAAALAAARYIPTNTARYQGVCPAPSSNKVAAAACETAARNGYVHGVDGNTVEVKYPPGPESGFSGISGYVEVRISNTRPSIFAGVLGLMDMDTSAMGIAANSAGVNIPYSLLALNPTGCGISKVNGNGGTVTVDAAIHVDSSCGSNALTLTGGGRIVAPTCDVVGGFLVQGASTNGCVQTPDDSQVAGDPLRTLPAPAKPALGRIQVVSGTKPVPPACPQSPAVTGMTSEDVPVTCVISGASYGSSSFRLSPGYYPGGLRFGAGTFYFDPGIYWIGGGGLQLTSNAIVMSTAAGGTTPGGGVLIYDTQDPAYAAQCATDRTFPLGTVTAHPTVAGVTACYSGFSVQGGTINLRPIQNTIYRNMVLFIDRTLSYRTATPPATTADILINGTLASVTMEGTIYAPAGLVTLNGDAGDSVSSQVIAYDFQVNGNGAGMTINYNGDKLFQLSGVGLVE